MMNKRLQRVVGQPQVPWADRAARLQQPAESSESHPASSRGPAPLLIENPFARGRLSHPKKALALKAFPDSFVNKGVLKVIVQLHTGHVFNVWNVHLQDSGSPELQQSQVRELLHLLHAAENGQVADLVGGDFNCTPGSPCWEELVASLGPSLQQISRAPPFVTWDGLSKEPSRGRTLDHIFVRARTAVPTLDAAPRVAFAAADRKQRLSDHLGIEAVLNLHPPANAMAALK